MGNCLVHRPLTQDHDDLFSKTSVNMTEYTNSIMDIAIEKDGSHFMFETPVQQQNAGDIGIDENQNYLACDVVYEKHQPVTMNSVNLINSQAEKHTNTSPFPDLPDSRILSQNENTSTVINRLDEDFLSCFGEHWDPILFDQRRRSQMKPGVFYDFAVNQLQQHTIRRHEGSILKRTRFAISHWPSINNLNRHSPRYRGLSLISSALLGFSQFQSSSLSKLEWYRNGELENPLHLKDNFRIKGKQKSKRTRMEINDNNREEDDYSLGEKGKKDCHTSREGWLRYTMFLHQQQGDAVDFYAILRKTKHVFLSLEAKTGCEVRFSKRLFVHKGKYVRTVVIDGPSRKNILRCYSSLPRLFTDLIIMECERPCVSESKISAPHCRMEFATSNMLHIVV